MTAFFLREEEEEEDEEEFILLSLTNDRTKQSRNGHTGNKTASWLFMENVHKPQN